MDGWVENNDFTKQRRLSLYVLLSLCLGVTFLRPRHTAKHTPSVLVIYRLAIDVLQSELGGDRHAHGGAIHGDTVKCSRPGEKGRKPSGTSWRKHHCNATAHMWKWFFSLTAVREEDVRPASYCVWWTWNQGNSTHPITAFTSSKHPRYHTTGKLLLANKYADSWSSLWLWATAYHWHAMKISDVMSSGSGPLVLLPLGQIHV